MGSRSYNRPSYVAAILLFLVAIVDAANGLVNMQIPDACKNATSSVSGLSFSATCGIAANNGWYTDLITAALCVALATFLLLRPERLVYAGTAVWSAIAFFANIVSRHSSNGIDALVTYRATVYLIIFVIAAILLIVVEWQAAIAADAAKAGTPASPAEPAPPAAPIAPAPWTKP